MRSYIIVRRGAVRI